MKRANLSTKKVLILGGLGFIGFNLACRLRKEGCEITIVDNNYIGGGANTQHLNTLSEFCEVRIGSISDENLMRDVISRCDILYNLAGLTGHKSSMENPLIDFNTNASSQLVIAEILKEYREIKHIFASTRQIYGNPKYLPVDERHTITPPDINAISKLTAENIFKFYSNFYETNTVILRLTNIYGPGMRIKDASQNFLGEWIRRTIAAEPIKVYGDGKLQRDFLYITDLVNLLTNEKLIMLSKLHIFNVGVPKSHTLEQVARLLISLMPGSRVERVVTPSLINKISPTNYYTDITRLRNECDWEPIIDLEIGLKETLNYFRDHRERYA